MNWRKRDNYNQTLVGICNEKELADFLDIAEAEGFTWRGGAKAKEAKFAMEFPAYIRITNGDQMSYGKIGVSEPKEAITVWQKDLYNYVIQARIHNKNKSSEALLSKKDGDDDIWI